MQVLIADAAQKLFNPRTGRKRAVSAVLKKRSEKLESKNGFIFAYPLRMLSFTFFSVENKIMMQLYFR